MSASHQFVRVDFYRFKAFERFTIHLRHFNVFVGPNNAGKSTILAAFRILAAGLRKAASRNPEAVYGPNGKTVGYKIDLGSVSVAEENIFYNYNDTEAASVCFHLSNQNNLTLYFPEKGFCYLLADGASGIPKTTKTFKSQFNCQIGFVPILGPVDHNEQLYQEEAARLALFNYTAARNFRNIWYHYPKKFEEFRKILKETWPGMDIDPPTIDHSHSKPVLHMFCPEDRIPREIFWAGFGFQVWCQMLTHLVQSSDKSLFLIDEPDIYLHSDLQRQLLGLLRNLGPDIIVATHSTEIITEAEADDIVLVNKKSRHARRIKSASQLAEVFAILGSNVNPLLTQLAKTKRAVFVEGKDFQIIGKIARKLGSLEVGNRASFAVIPVEGFSPERIRSLKKGIETTLGGSIATAAILDRDFRSEAECKAISVACEQFCDFVSIHICKEIENFLLVPTAIDRAAEKRLEDGAKRSGQICTYKSCAHEILEEFSREKKTYVTSQYLAARRRFEKSVAPGNDEATSNESALSEFEERWSRQRDRIAMIPGKEALGKLNGELQQKQGITVTQTSIIEAMHVNEIPNEMKSLIAGLSIFSKSQPVFETEQLI